MSGESAVLRGIAERALGYVSDGTVVGLGTGRAANAFVRVLGERVAAGLRVRGVPTSEATAALAREVGIPLSSLKEAGLLDTTFDGADEVSPALDLIKGYGGAMVREKIVAASSRRLVILVGDEKVVQHLGERGRLPVEVLPFGAALAERELQALGCTPRVREADGAAYQTDNGNLVFDCAVGPIDDPAGLERRILAIPGVLGTGLFVGMADVVLVQAGEDVVAMERDGGSVGRSEKENVACNSE